MTSMVDPAHVLDGVVLHLTAGVVERIPLPESAFERFVELTGASSPDGLDDGEAATIATAEVLGLAAALDERKGRRVAASRTPSIPLVCSVEIFAMAEVGAALRGQLADAVFSACIHARMRVLPEHAFELACHRVGRSERENIWSAFPKNEGAAYVHLNKTGERLLERDEPPTLLGKAIAAVGPEITVEGLAEALGVGDLRGLVGV